MVNLISEKISLLQGDSLKAKSARGIMKLGIGTGIERTLRFVRTMILTRILLPDEFGLMSIVLVLVNIFEAFTEIGIKQSVIQNKRGNDSEYLNVAWWFQSLRGIGLFIIAILVAPWISSFYDKPHLLKLLQATFLVVIFRGFISPRAHVLIREYKFGRSVLLVQGSALVGTIVTICLALYTRNIWALIIGYVAEQGTLCLLSYILVPFLPKFHLDRDYLRELVKFSRGMFGLSILTIIGFGAPVFVLGKVVTEGKVGLYSLAIHLACLPIDLFTKIISPVLLPGFAQKQDDRDSLCRAVLKMSRWLAVAVIPLVTFMACCASGLLILAWGPKYIDSTIPCAILSLLILARTQAVVLTATNVAIGQPELHRRFVALRALIIVGLIYPAVVHWELVGAAVVTILGNLTALFMQVFWSRKVINLKFNSYLRCYIPGLLLAFPVILTIHIMLWLGVDSMVVILAAGAFALLVTYTAYFKNILFLKNHMILL